MTKKKLIIISLLSSFTVIVIIGVTMYCSITTPIDNSTMSYLYIDDDDDVDSVCAKADELLPGISDLMFDLVTKMSSYKNHIHTGRYEVTPTTTTLELFMAIRGHRTVPVKLVVPSVRTLDEIAERLSNQLMMDKNSLKAIFDDETKCAELGFTHETMPAFFIPETYEVYWDTSADRLLEKLSDGYRQFWNEERNSKAKAIGFTPVEVSTLASIVDSETTSDKEKPSVAGLYMNRLKKGMLLQSDPTVIYACGDFTIRRVLKKHLKIKSPYNTYIYKGLPPGPIRVPTVAGIDAVLNYEHNNYLFMCAKEDLSGTHNFASNGAEHRANAIKYQKALNQRGITR